MSNARASVVRRPIRDVVVLLVATRTAYAASVRATRTGERKVEKPLPRDAFKGLLLDAVLRRTSEAFSNGVSPLQHSWHNILQTDREKRVSDTEFEQKAARYT